MNDKGRPNNSARLLRAVLLILSGSLATMSAAGRATGQEPPKGANQALQDEIKSVQATLAKLQTEIKQLRADLKAAEVGQEEATVKWVKSFAGTFLDSILKGKDGDAGDMLAKSLTGKDQRLSQLRLVEERRTSSQKGRRYASRISRFSCKSGAIVQ